MKRGIVLFLAVIVLMQCSMKLLIVAYYQLNKDYISSTLCENREKPEMKCNGKCYLEKKIKAQDQKETKLPSLLKESENIVLYFSAFELVVPSIYYKVQLLLNSVYLIKPYQSPVAGIFQPPQ